MSADVEYPKGRDVRWSETSIQVHVAREISPGPECPHVRRHEVRKSIDSLKHSEEYK